MIQDISREPVTKKDALVWWDGVKDKFSYNLKNDSIKENIGNFLSLEMPSSSVPREWLELLEKHDNKFDNVSFDIDPKLNQKKDQFKVDIAPDYKDIKLVKTKR